MKTQIYNEGELKEKINNDNYHLQRCFKFAVLVFLILGLAIFAYSFFYKLFNDAAFNDKILGTVAEHIGTIIFILLYIIGINYLKKQ